MKDDKPEGRRPDRAELLALRKRIILVEHGHRVLKMKQDVLPLALSRPIAATRERRRAVSETFARARHAISIARMTEGSVGIRIAAFPVENPLGIAASRRNVTGLSLRSSPSRTRSGRSISGATGTPARAP